MNLYESEYKLEAENVKRLLKEEKNSIKALNNLKDEETKERYKHNCLKNLATKIETIENIIIAQELPLSFFRRFEKLRWKLIHAAIIWTKEDLNEREIDLREAKAEYKSHLRNPKKTREQYMQERKK